MVIIKLGLTHVIQLKIHGLRLTLVVQALTMEKRQKVLSQVSESNAWVSLKRSQRV